MKILHDGVEYEFGNDRSDKIFETQNKYVTNLIERCRKNKDTEGMLIALISLNYISRQYLKAVEGELKIEEIVQILQATKANLEPMDKEANE